MKYLKEYETRLNVTPVEMYNGSMRTENLLQFLKNKFEGRCMDSGFITNIKSIKNKSMIQIDKSALDGSGAIHIWFYADTLVYNRDEILVGCEVTNIDPSGMIICKYENAIINVNRRDNKNYAPNIGDLIIVVVENSGYSAGSDKVAVVAKPYVLSLHNDLKRTEIVKLEPDITEMLSLKLEEYENLMVEYNSLDKHVTQFFENMFYPTDIKKYIDTKAKEGASIKTKFNTWNIVETIKSAINDSNPFKDKMIIACRHIAIPKKIPRFVTMTPDEIKTSGDNLIEKSFTFGITPEPYSSVLTSILMDCINYLKLIIDCVKTYSTDQIRKNHTRLWEFYVAQKKQLNNSATNTNNAKTK